jgi:hypothetical protein
MKRRKFETKDDVTPKVKLQALEKPYTPKPDMGDVKPPAPAEKACAFCTHTKKNHYGGTMGWCNTGGCTCMEFK